MQHNGHGKANWSPTSEGSSSDEEEEDRLLLSPDRLKKSRRFSPAVAEHLLTMAYFLIMAINGGMIGAFGPSLQMLERATGLTEYQVGKFVMQNRLSKVRATGAALLAHHSCPPTASDAYICALVCAAAGGHARMVHVRQVPSG